MLSVPQKLRLTLHVDYYILLFVMYNYLKFTGKS